MDRPGRNGGTLRDFEKGQSGNPTGRPAKRDLISQLMKEYGQNDALEVTIRSTDVNGVSRVQHLSYEVDGKENTIFAILAVQLLMRAVDGNFEAYKIVLDRTEGRVPRPMTLAGLGNTNPLVVVYDKPEEVPDKAALDPLATKHV